MNNKLILSLAVFIGFQLVAIEEIEVKKDEPLIITLPDNHESTGYSWSPILSKDDILEFSEEKYIPSESIGLGTPGQKEFTFKTPVVGTQMLIFKKMRPWEKKSAPVETREYLITVSEEQ